MLKLLFGIIFLFGVYTNSFAAVGCSLDDPDRDVKRLFPESSGYLTKFITLKEIGGQALLSKVEEKLGDKFDTVYESLDVPYAYYVILKGKDTVGYIHGVNQKGKFGVLQLVVAVDLQGKIISFYYQRMSSPESANFRKTKFTDQFKGLSLLDFAEYDVLGKDTKAGRVSRIADPSVGSPEDFKATLRGIKKDLILLDEFLHGREKLGGQAK